MYYTLSFLLFLPKKLTLTPRFFTWFDFAHHRSLRMKESSDSTSTKRRKTTKNIRTPTYDLPSVRGTSAVEGVL